MPGLFTSLAFLLKDFFVFAAYVKNNAFPQPLPADKELMYLQQFASGDIEARNKLIEHNLRLVAHIAKKFDNSTVDTDDLISIGTIGLIKAIESYSVNKGTKLATYASKCIENEILMVLRSSKKTRKDVSLHEPIGHDKEGNNINLIDILVAETEDVVENMQLNSEIKKAMKYLNILDERELEVIIKRFGLGNFDSKTQREIANELNISRSYVSRIEKRALMKMYHEFYRAEQNKTE